MSAAVTSVKVDPSFPASSGCCPDLPPHSAGFSRLPDRGPIAALFGRRFLFLGDIEEVIRLSSGYCYRIASENKQPSATFGGGFCRRQSASRVEDSFERRCRSGDGYRRGPRTADRGPGTEDRFGRAGAAADTSAYHTPSLNVWCTGAVAGGRKTAAGARAGTRLHFPWPASVRGRGRLSVDAPIYLHLQHKNVETGNRPHHITAMTF